MGIVFGRTGTKEPTFKLLRSAPYEIRVYPPYFVAEVQASEDSVNDSFRELAKYIGVFGEPENVKGATIEMTAPVITTPEKIAMTSPVVTNRDIMQFVLPFEFTSIDQIPVPTSKRISIKSIPERVVAVTCFPGAYNRNYCMQKLNELHRQLIADHMLVDDEDDKDSKIGESALAMTSSATVTVDDSEKQLKWFVAQYHPPFTLPFLRRNEVWVDLVASSSSSRDGHGGNKGSKALQALLGEVS